MIMKFLKQALFGSPKSQITLDEIPRYPPFVAGLPNVELNLVLESQKELITWIKNNLALGEEDYKKFVHDVITRYAAFVHFIPASEAHHHRGAGGLFRHGLEVAKFMLEDIHGTNPYATPLNTDPPQKKNRDMHYWRLANFYAGLLHDIGKPLTDVRVTDKDGRVKWRPRELSLSEWLNANGLDRYYIHWQKDRYKLHETLGPFLVDQILGKDISGLFAHEANFVFNDLVRSVSKMDDDTDMVLRVIKCDQRSTGIDLEQNNYNPDTQGSAVPVFSYIKDIIRDHVEEGDWKVNTKGYPIWYSDDGLFIAWKKATEDIRHKARKMGIKGFPHSHISLAEIMVSRGAAQKPETGNEDALLWHISPDILTRTDGKRITFWALKIRNPESFIELDLLPNKVDILIPGVNDTGSVDSACLSNDIDVQVSVSPSKAQENPQIESVDQRESNLSSLVDGFLNTDDGSNEKFTSFNISDLQGESSDDVFAAEESTTVVPNKNTDIDLADSSISEDIPISTVTSTLDDRSIKTSLLESVTNESTRSFLKKLLDSNVPVVSVNGEQVIPLSDDLAEALTGSPSIESKLYEIMDDLLDDRVLQSVPGRPRSVVFEIDGFECVKINKRYFFEAEKVLSYLVALEPKEQCKIDATENSTVTEPLFENEPPPFGSEGAPVYDESYFGAPSSHETDDSLLANMNEPASTLSSSDIAVTTSHSSSIDMFSGEVQGDFEAEESPDLIKDDSILSPDLKELSDALNSTVALDGDSKTEKALSLINQYLLENGTTQIEDDHIVINVEDLQDFGASKKYESSRRLLMYISTHLSKEPIKGNEDTVLIKNFENGRGAFFNIPGVV